MQDRSLHILKHHCDGNEVCAFIGYMVTIVMNGFLHCLWEVLQDPLYSPDVSPCDYDTIPPQRKQALHGKQFANREDILTVYGHNVVHISGLSSADCVGCLSYH